MTDNLSPEQEARLKDLLDNYESMKRTIEVLKVLGKIITWVASIMTPILALWLSYKHGTSGMTK